MSPRISKIRPPPPQRDFHFRAQLPRDGGGWNARYLCHSCDYSWRGRPMPDGIARCPACGETVRITCTPALKKKSYSGETHGTK